MFVGVAVWDLHLAGCASLKEKRRIVRSLRDRLRHQLNVSVAETDHQDLLQRAGLAACVVSSGRRNAQQVLSSADQLVEGEPRVRIIASSITFY